MHTVLLVDDNDDIRDCVRDTLDAERYSVRTAVNGKEAIDLLQQGVTPDVMLVDLMMPVMNGFELIEHLRHSEKWSRIPIVVVSANRGYDAEQLHVASIVRKPFSLESLEGAVETALRAA